MYLPVSWTVAVREERKTFDKNRRILWKVLDSQTIFDDHLVAVAELGEFVVRR